MTITIPSGRTLPLKAKAGGGFESAIEVSGGASGGTAALSWSAPSGLADGATVIIETDGTNDFGFGPDPAFAYYMDLSELSAGDSVPPASNFDPEKSNNANANPQIYDNGLGIIRGKCVGAFNTPEGFMGGEFLKPDAGALNGAALFTEVFFTYTQRIPNDTALAGPGNQKPFWLMLGDRGDNWNFPSPDGTEGHDLYVIGATGGGSSWGQTIIAGNNGEIMPSPTGWTLGDFATDQMYCKLNQVDPTLAPEDYYASRTTLNTGTDSVRGATNSPLDATPDRQAIYQAFAWDRVKIPGFYNDSSGTLPQEVYQSGIYVAAGPNAWAHVDLCDSVTEATASKRVICKPVSWSPNRIEVQVFSGNVNLQTEGVLQIRKGNGDLIAVPLGAV